MLNGLNPWAVSDKVIKHRFTKLALQSHAVFSYLKSFAQIYKSDGLRKFITNDEGIKLVELFNRMNQLRSRSSFTKTKNK
jgi:hypothetical protein